MDLKGDGEWVWFFLGGGLGKSWVRWGQVGVWDIGMWFCIQALLNFFFPFLFVLFFSSFIFCVLSPLCLLLHLLPVFVLHLFIFLSLVLPRFYFWIFFSSSCFCSLWASFCRLQCITPAFTLCLDSLLHCLLTEDGQPASLTLFCEPASFLWLFWGAYCSTCCHLFSSRLTCSIRALFSSVRHELCNSRVENISEALYICLLRELVNVLQLHCGPSVLPWPMRSTKLHWPKCL